MDRIFVLKMRIIFCVSRKISDDILSLRSTLLHLNNTSQRRLKIS